MRTLGEIVESARDGTVPSLEECYWAMLALNSLSTFDDMDFSRMARQEKDGKPIRAYLHYEERFNRSKRAWGEDPRKWVGWDNDPANPNFQKRRTVANKIVSAAMNASNGYIHERLAEAEKERDLRHKECLAKDSIIEEVCEERDRLREALEKASCGPRLDPSKCSGCNGTGLPSCICGGKGTVEGERDGYKVAALERLLRAKGEE